MQTLNIGLVQKYTRNMSVLFVGSNKHLKQELFELIQEIFPNIIFTQNGEHALNNYQEYYYSQKQYYDLIITDIKMPKIDGVKLVREIYKKNEKQIIVVLSSCTEYKYLLPLLNLGIEKFLKKPVEFDIFLNDIIEICQKIYLSKENKNKQYFIRIHDTLIWDKERKILTLDRKNIKLTKKEILLIDILLKEKNRIYTASELINILWFDTFDVETDIINLKNVISRLRKKVPNLIIQNIYGMGYKVDFTTN